MRKHPLIVASALLITALAAPLPAGPTRNNGHAAPRAAVPAPADVVRTRVAGLRELGAAFKNVSDGMRGEPQMIIIQQSARQIKTASVALRNWFPANSGPQPGIKTAAKPEVWSKPNEFRAAADNFARQADAFQIAAASGNADAIRAAFRSLGGACKGCHDQFRVPEQH